ncbi:MAG: SpoIIAA family protein [Burkholderiales bacterium]
MIAIDIKNNVVSVSVLGEFTLADFKQFEEHMLYGIKFQGSVNLLIDLRDMLGYSVDVVWEELKFSKAHEREFGKVAVVSSDQWVTWSAWLQRFFIAADIEVFSDFDAAQAWVASV